MKRKVFQNYFSVIQNGAVHCMYACALDLLEFLPEEHNYTFAVLNPSTGEGVEVSEDYLRRYCILDDDLPF